MNPSASFWQGRRVLLTGHTGFKGSWLTLWLEQLGAQVHGFSLDPEPVAPPGQPLFRALNLAERLGERHRIGDLCDRGAVAAAVDAARPEVVLHLAAQPLVLESYRDPLTTWSTNVIGSLELLEALRRLEHRCAVVLVTTDKVYANQEWPWGYRETDRLGGHDPYSASKAALELLAESWRSSFCGEALHQTPHLQIATARSGNVIGGGDWATDRIVPDAVRALAAGQPLELRNPMATRPWQHVLEPLAGYLRLAEALFQSEQGGHGGRGNPWATAFNFGPEPRSHRPTRELATQLARQWPGQPSWRDASDPAAPHEAGQLQLVADRAHHLLAWEPRWDFSTTVARTGDWYRQVLAGTEAEARCLADLAAYCSAV
ncbi:MAG: CDP-glucose 4,6-dehydratase [Prochlorococcaceae cyanobacterium]